METKKRRFFAFGCSFTRYGWPTWADILAKHYHSLGWEVYNFGLSGSGNMGIAHAISAADVKYDLTEDDIICVMWTSWTREDRVARFRDNVELCDAPGWCQTGNTLNSDIFDDEWLHKFWSLENDIINTVTAIRLINKSYPFITFQGSIGHVEIGNPATYNKEDLDSLLREIVDIHHINEFPMLYEMDFNSKQLTRNIRARGLDDGHFLPEVHYNILKKQIFPNLHCGTELSPSIKKWCQDWTQHIIDFMDEKPFPMDKCRTLLEDQTQYCLDHGELWYQHGRAGVSHDRVLSYLNRSLESMKFKRD